MDKGQKKASTRPRAFWEIEPSLPLAQWRA